MTHDTLLTSIYNTLLDLATEDGINASGKNDVYGCIFGRDSAITILKILSATKRDTTRSRFEVSTLYSICRRGLLTLMDLQGKESNLESGEAPGKFIHEYRKEKYERLLNQPKPWYVYPDGILRNYDSIDSTPLCLIAIYRYWDQTQDHDFLLRALPAVEAGLNWIITYGDMDKDFLLEYSLPEERKHGGLVVQSWTDSHESMEDAQGKFPLYPIAPVEAQGYAWLALKLWADFYKNTSLTFARTESFANKLLVQAKHLKERFNQAFIFKDGGLFYAAQALDGYKNQIKTITGNPLLLLWASYVKEGSVESILEEQYVTDVVRRAFKEDMFEEDAGVRTMSTKSPTFIPGQNSYHNGSFWPKLNGMSHEGLRRFGFKEEAQRLRQATLTPLMHFGTPIELYVKSEDGSFLPYLNEQGQEACREQAWSAATALDLLTI